MGDAVFLDSVSKRFYLRQMSQVGFLKGVFSLPEYFSKQKELWALRDVSFNVAEGECVGLVGLNGSGKSTLLRIIEGIYTPTCGEVLLNADTCYLQLGLGFIPELSVSENVFLHGSIMGLDKSKLKSCFDDIIRFAELEDFVDAKLRTLSSGMLQRLAFSTNMFTDAEIILLDEVFSVGDEVFVKKCQRVMDDFRREGRTLIFASHQLQVISKTCSKTLVLDEGKSVFFGPTCEALRVYEDIGKRKGI